MNSTSSQRALGLFLLLLSSALLSSGAPAEPAASVPESRLVILGIDGGDGRTARALMDAGQLPNLSRLAEGGTFEPLWTTNPAESPVSWASLNCGQNPAKTGVPGFVRRKLLDSAKSPALPAFGHLVTDDPVQAADFRNAPIVTWEPLQLGGAVGGAVLGAFLIVFGLLLRMRFLPALAISLVLGGIGFFGGYRLRGYLPAEIPRLTNPLKAEPFWEHAARNGVESIILDAAQCFGREPVEGAKVLAGLGVPDARGDIQSFFIYTTDELYLHEPPPDKSTGTSSGGDKFRVYLRDGRIESAIYGPTNFWLVDRLERRIEALEEERGNPRLGADKSLALSDRLREAKAELKGASDDPLTAPLVVEMRGEGALVTLGTESQELSVGEWSDWYHLSFELNPLLKIKAITRVKILSMEGPFELYVNTIEIDPAAPPFWQPISQPHSFAQELEAAIGPFETIGWACMTMPFKDEILDPVSFMQDIEFTIRWREKMLYETLGRDDWRVLMSVLSTPDRVQHMMYQFYDEEHPIYDAAAASRTMTFFGEEITLSDAIPAVYRQVDRIVGEVVDKYLGAGDTLMICADHGFQTFRRGVNVNNWLLEKGYLAVKPGLSKKSDGNYLRFVDWSKTQAYSLGLGMVYLNLEGREAGGIVAEEDADELMARIHEDFVSSVDDATGERIGANTYVMREIHEGPYVDLEADMMLGFAATYRVSWGTTTGGLKMVQDESGSYGPGPIYEDSRKNWSGDHVSVDPSLVRGMFFSNRRVEVPEGGVNILHIAPTALDLMGVSVPPEYDYPPLVFSD